jgi:hypothetical protein
VPVAYQCPTDGLLVVMSSSNASPKAAPAPLRKPVQTIKDGAVREDQIRENRPNVYKSFLLTRLLVGIVGVLLPTFLVAWHLGSEIVTDGPLGLRGSLSAYYYHSSPLRDWFVGSLWAIGVGLMVYMGTRKSWANLISWIAGFAALAVSLFPTNQGGTPATWVARLHFSAAAVLIIGLGLLCIGFGVYDKERRDTDRGKQQRRWIHYVAAIVIFAAVTFVVLNSLFDIWPSHGLLVAEVAAIYAFAISWFAKGLELVPYSREHPNDASGIAPIPVAEAAGDRRTDSVLVGRG